MTVSFRITQSRFGRLLVLAGLGISLWSDHAGFWYGMAAVSGVLLGSGLTLYLTSFTPPDREQA